MPGPVLFPIAKSITTFPSTWREAKSDTTVCATVKVVNCDKHLQFNCPSSPKTVSETEHL